MKGAGGMERHAPSPLPPLSSRPLCPPLLSPLLLVSRFFPSFPDCCPPSLVPCSPGGCAAGAAGPGHDVSPHAGIRVVEADLRLKHLQVMRAIWCSGSRIATQSEVIRAIVLEDSPC